MKNVIRNENESLEEAFIGQCSKYLQIRPLNEAQLTADHLISALQNEFLVKKDTMTCLPYQVHMGLTPSNAPYKTVVFGFGEIGQYALKELCINTSSLQADRKTPKKFCAKVYDKNALEKMGQFSYAHPMYHCFNGENSTEPGSAQGEEDMLGCPSVWFYEESCFSQGFMKQIDTTMGDAVHINDEISSYIVSLGSDEDNLSFANLMLADRKHELWLNRKGQIKQIIFVHIRDEKNIARLNWTEQDRMKWNDNLRVVAFGCRESIWSYDNIIDDDKDRIFHYVYKIVSKGINQENQATKDEKELYDELLKENENGNQQIIKEKIDQIKASDAYKEAWLSANIFHKESNRSVRKYAVNYFPYKRMGGDMEYFVRLEKLRWNRFHMSHGWIFANKNSVEELSKKQKEERKKDREHPDLLEYDQTTAEARKYDQCNVYLGTVEMMMN